MARIAVALACLLSLPPPSVSTAFAQASTVGSQARPLEEFKKRVNAYIALRKKAVDQVGPLDPTKSPKQIADREQALGEAIRALRAGAKQGDVIAPQTGAILRTIIHNEYAHRSQLALRNRQDAQDELPDFTPTVNQIYPTAHPLATFPPLVLRQLPPLPKPLEYRFVQRSLIVRDSEANLIVDVLPDAVPATSEPQSRKPASK
jgi:lipoprotein-anchoring transpeptidase ErfK/SrfK